MTCPDPSTPWGLLAIAATVGLVLGACAGCGLMAVIAGGATEDAWRAGEAAGWKRATGWADLDDTGRS